VPAQVRNRPSPAIALRPRLGLTVTSEFNVFVRGLRIELLAAELALAGQPPRVLRVDIVVSLPPRQVSDLLSDTLDYEQLVACARTLAAKPGIVGAGDFVVRLARSLVIGLGARSANVRATLGDSGAVLEFSITEAHDCPFEGRSRRSMGGA
jgi:hypothetical protein